MAYRTTSLVQEITDSTLKQTNVNHPKMSLVIKDAFSFPEPTIFWMDPEPLVQQLKKKKKRWGSGDENVKDDIYFFYCAYVLRISRYSGFPWVVPTNTGILLRSL